MPEQREDDIVVRFEAAKRGEKPRGNGAAPKDETLVRLGALMGTQFPPIRWVVRGIIPEGLTLLAGKPKSGKSWLALGAAYAVAIGGQTLGQNVEQGDVLYLALEDNQRRLQSRLQQIIGLDVVPDHGAERMSFATSWPRVDVGGIEKIEAWVKAAKHPRLVVVDVLAKVRPTKRKDEGLYEGDYRALEALKKIADEHRLGVVVVHHVSKRTEAEDAFDLVSGTTGLTGAADSVLVLRKQSEGTTLYGRGRDMTEIEKALSFDESRGLWTLLGNANDVSRSSERKRILDVVEHALDAPTTAEIVAATGMRKHNVEQLIYKMLRAGEIEHAEGRRGRYAMPSKRDKRDQWSER